MTNIIKCPYCNSSNVTVYGRCMASLLHSCTDCGASEIGAYADDDILSSEEMKTGWYKPQNF